MTIREAVSLVLQAFAIGRHGDILVLDMGEPVKIADLARKLIRLAGKSEEEVPIRYTGLRPGEKLHEELFYSSEQMQPSSHPKIKQVRFSGPGWPDLMAQFGELKRLARTGRPRAIRACISEIVPEYQNPVRVQIDILTAENHDSVFKRQLGA